MPKTCRRSISARQLPHSPALVSGKRCQLFLPSLWALPVLRPVNTGYWQEGDKAKRLAQIRGDLTGRRVGRLQPVGVRAGTRVAVGEQHPRLLAAAAQHCEKSRPEDHDRHTLVSTQPNHVQPNLRSYSRTPLYHTLISSNSRAYSQCINPTICPASSSSIVLLNALTFNLAVCQSSYNRLSPFRLLHQDLIVGSGISNTV